MRRKVLKFLQSKLFLKLITVASILIPFLIFSYIVFKGYFPFWYDPARDFLLALDNLKNPTFIGPPSGIPGVFYGPYWIWLISLGVMINKDPRFTAFLIGVIPYTIIFPFVLFRFSKLWGMAISILLWLVFVTSFGQNYATYLWNPHVAPLLFLGLIYTLFRANFLLLRKSNSVFIILAGLLLGFILNFHISFGIGVVCGSILWIFSYNALSLRGKKISQAKIKSFICCVVLLGVSMCLTFLPFFAFELKNGFTQTQATINTLIAQGSVVNVVGLSNGKIIEEFVMTSQKLFLIPSSVSWIILSAIILIIMYLSFFKRNALDAQSIKLTSLLLILLGSIGIVYLTSKNPVWEYHFIGIELILLLLCGVLLKTIRWLKVLLWIWVIFMISQFLFKFHQGLNINPLTIPTLSTKEYMIDQIYEDSKGESFEVFAYNPAIYTYDFSYILGIRGTKKRVSPRPEEIPMNSSLVYIILPKEGQQKHRDFIQYRTPDKNYKTIRKIVIPDGSEILRRQRINE